MAKKVRFKSVVKHDGVDYVVGAEQVLDDEAADALCASGVAEVAVEAPPAPEPEAPAAEGEPPPVEDEDKVKKGKKSK